LCTCGSGRKFKHCHGRYPTQSATNKRRHEASQRQRQEQQGLGKPIVSFPLARGRAVVVGRQLMTGQWATFVDFLLDYIAQRLGRDWFAIQMSSSTDEHPLGAWGREVAADRGRSGISQGITKRRINNGFRSLLSLAYSLYLIEHHYEQYEVPIFEEFIGRLKRNNEFLPTMSEINAAAFFLRAGFKLKYESRRSGGHRAEFIATFPATDRRFSVEVKTRTGAPRAEESLRDRIKLKNKLSQALKKNLPWSRVVFVDLNLPDVVTDAGDRFFENLLTEVDEAERTLRIHGCPAPPAYLFLVNQPHHYNLQDFEGAPFIGALGFRLPNFQPRQGSFRDIIISREEHPEMTSLIDSMKAHRDPPATFDGQNPELVFRPTAEQRWLIGERYLVPSPKGDIVAELQSAIATPEKMIMHGIFATNDSNFIVSCPMTDSEVAAYELHPEVFFGAVQNVTKRAESVLELAEFFYESYRHTPRETLLSFIKDSPIHEAAANWSQRDLAIFVSEQWALNAENKRSTASPEQAPG
jgi:hypothetical protein